MAAEISPYSDTTDGNRDDYFLGPIETRLSSIETANLVDLHAEVHEILRIQREMYAVLVRFRPLLDQFGASPLATRRAVRKAVRG